MILVTTVSCSTSDMPRIPEWSSAGPSFSGRATDAAKPQEVQRGEEQPKVRRGQPGTFTSSKVATVHIPKATSTSVPRNPSKKANTPPRLDAQREQLFQEFLEWRRRQKDRDG
jgi:hypothetical protein